MGGGEAGAVDVGGECHRDVELQLFLFLQRLHERDELVVFRGVQYGAAGMEVDVVHLLAAAEQVAEQSEWCSGDFREQIENGFPDERPDSELRVVQAARYRQVDVDDAVAVLEQGHRDLQRQVDRIGTFNTVTQLQLVDDELVGGG